jgi:hypothetical protein
MKKPSAKTKTERYLVTFSIRNKQTGISERKQEFAYSFGKEDNDKIAKEIENKYRGQGYKVTIESIE